MNARVPVVAGSAPYRVAVAGLPMQAMPGDRIAGSVVVVDGAADWWTAAASAIDAGASAVLVAEPLDVPHEAVRDLARRSDVPVVVHRSRLRPELVASAVAHREGVAPRVLVAECQVGPAQLELVVRDAVGWLRELADAPLSIASASTNPGGGAALVRAEGVGIVASLTITATRREGMLLRVQALGETTTELEIDEPTGTTELATGTRRGRLVAPALYEDAERESLRRAVDAVAGGGPTDDLRRLLHDAELAAAIIR